MVVVSHETRELTLAAVASVAVSEGVRPHIRVVDNASSDGTVEALRARSWDAQVGAVALDENVGFGRANNLGMEEGAAPWILLLNSDATFAGPDGLRRLVEVLASRPRAAVVGPRLVAPDGGIEHSVRAFPSVTAELLRGTGLHRLLPRAARARLLALEFHDPGVGGAVEWITGACMLVRRAAVDEVGGFDPAIFMYGEELEWCWRMRRAGWEVRYEPSVTVRHLRGASGGGGEWRRRAAMAGDAYVVRKHRGSAYLGAFAVARAVGLTLQSVIQGALGRLGGNAERRARARAARADLRAWVHALRRGGATRPDAGWFGPSATEGRTP